MSARDSLRQMTRRVFLKVASAATAASALLLTSAEEGCGGDAPGSGPCHYGYGYSHPYFYGGGYGYGYGCYGVTVSDNSDLVIDRVGHYLGKISRREWTVRQGTRVKIRIS